LKVDLWKGLAECDGLLELVLGKLPLALEDQEDAEVVVNIVIVGLEGDGFFKMSAGVDIILVDPLNNGVEIEDFRIVRVLGEQFGAERARFVNVVAHDLSAEELELNVRIAGVVDEGLAEDLDCLFKTLHVDLGHSERSSKGKRLGSELEAVGKNLVGLLGVVEKTVCAGKVEGERLCAWSGVEELDDAKVVLAEEQFIAEALERWSGGGVDGESLLPLLFPVGVLASTVKERGENQVRLDDSGIKARGLQELGDRLGLVAATEEGKAGEEAELCGGRVALERGLERVHGAAELVAARVPTAEEDGVFSCRMRG
jgi:hypothetical protein